ncbi:arginine--tRNA ligase [Candidatus Halobeggiatoa sp. HSG11]|nr:arginine--tRNA ligase [Candidatus Halobeggiatoa sp. HSG11]
MKQHLQKLFTQALEQLQISQDIRLERTRDNQHGDFACNIAMVLAKKLHKKPRDIATSIVEKLPKDDFIAKVEIAGPGFINIFLTKQAYYATIDDILRLKTEYGKNQLGNNQSVLIEFVSANPTGPLHVGHGRGAAYGAALANLLQTVGFKVHKEYYVNDAGRQMDILAVSVWLRYLELCDETIEFPANGYQGDYIWDIAADLHRNHAAMFHKKITEIFADIPPDEKDGGDKELHIDGLIQRSKQLLEKDYKIVFKQALDTILANIRHDLEKFGVEYEEWFPESNLTDTNKVQQTIDQLQAANHTYEKDGALWFKASDFGDEKDRVIVRDNGQFTYFASDIAYHKNKLERGFDQLINIWGADHHGYVPRVKTAMTALGYNAEQLTVLLVQFATLYRGKERLQMSTRSGEFVTLRELREEVGRDAARFFYIQRKSEQHLNFDLELAKSQTNENPVYYIQYAHARICSVMRQLTEQGQSWQHNKLANLETAHEQALLVMLARYPEVIEMAAIAHEPHQLTYYLRELAQNFHSFYDTHKILVTDNELRDARLSLTAAVQQILQNGLTIIGVSAPEVM